ncbi:MAG: helix-turn-helix domain-containing protein [Treponema sp.]|nr:helix-turn-helix domain-containing protein [Treponema sp.]
MTKTNIIQRRDLEPLWLKATEVVRHYERAVDCIAAVIGADCVSVELSRHPKATLFCSLCKRYYQCAPKLAPHEIPCTAMHLDAVRSALRLGGSYVYTCPAGFVYWTSPFFSGERFAGALTSSGLPAVDKQRMVDKLFNIYKKEIPRAEIANYLEDLPEKSSEDIKALAQMMLLCAEQISCREPHRDDLPECSSGHYYMDQERSLIASLRRGDRTEAHNLLRSLLDNQSIASKGNFEHFKLKAIELVVLLSRTGTNLENNEELVKTNNVYLKRIENVQTTEELTETMSLILERMAGNIFSFQGVRHSSALRKAERFIWENYNKKISLKEIAAVSGLSAPYFSTVFKDEMGENFSNYLNRIRIEKASAMLKETDSSISGISAVCGFEDQSWFSKIFKKYTGLNPCTYRKNNGVVS